MQVVVYHGDLLTSGKCTEEQLVEALTGKSHAMHRQLLALQLERLRLLDEQIARLNSLIAQAMKPHQDSVIRLAEVPGLGIDSEHQIIAKAGVTASTFSSGPSSLSWSEPSRQGRKRRRELQQPFGEMQQIHARAAQPACSCGCHERKAPTLRQCSGVCCRASVISPQTGPSHIDSAVWYGRSCMKESATSSKGSNPNLSFP
jgi:hypothetical protein